MSATRNDRFGRIEQKATFGHTVGHGMVYGMRPFARINYGKRIFGSVVFAHGGEILQ